MYFNIASVSCFLVFWPEIEPMCPALEGEVLTTGLPGKFQEQPLLITFSKLKTPLSYWTFSSLHFSFSTHMHVFCGEKHFKHESNIYRLSFAIVPVTESFSRPEFLLIYTVLGDYFFEFWVSAFFLSLEVLLPCSYFTTLLLGEVGSFQIVPNTGLYQLDPIFTAKNVGLDSKGI